MSRTFAYCRVSKIDLATENQVKQIRDAGYALDDQRCIEEQVSGSVAAFSRDGFVKLVDRMERGDVMIVTKMDRLGRSAMDVMATVKRLADKGIRVHCLQLGGVDLTSPSGKMQMGMLAVVAEFERDLIIERTQAGLAVAKDKGVKLGRKPTAAHGDAETIRAALASGKTVSETARAHGVSRATIIRIRDAQPV